MKLQRFEEIQKRNQNDKIKLCYELHAEMFKPIDYNQFSQLFQTWLSMFAGKSVDEAILYFKMNKIKD